MGDHLEGQYFDVWTPITKKKSHHVKIHVGYPSYYGYFFGWTCFNFVALKQLSIPNMNINMD